MAQLWKIRLMERQLPAEWIPVSSEYVLYSEDEGIIAERSTPHEAVRALAEHLREAPFSAATIYQNGDSGWTVF